VLPETPRRGRNASDSSKYSSARGDVKEFPAAAGCRLRQPALLVAYLVYLRTAPRELRRGPLVWMLVLMVGWPARKNAAALYCRRPEE